MSVKHVAPDQIETNSLAIIEAEVGDRRPVDGPEWLVLRRLIHASADFELLDLFRFHPRAVERGVQALRSGCTVVTDTRMAQCGIPLRRMEPLGCTVTCFMGDAATKALAAEQRVTQAAAAVDLACELNPQIMVVGNAPTALLRILERIEEGRLAPALVVGMPVGFVNAAESKELLLAQDHTPYLSIQGRKGGSPLAAAAVNALAEIALHG
ncbi:MAG: precorrin-8X methylmutase [Desulfovibrionaceae bacterium]